MTLCRHCCTPFRPRNSQQLYCSPQCSEAVTAENQRASNRERQRRRTAERKAPCLHCGLRTGTRPRGLCPKCYDIGSVRERYPSASNYAPRPEPTEAEIEAMVAEQMACLPPWWDRETRKLAERKDG
jgi:hypothetical protein